MQIDIGLLLALLGGLVGIAGWISGRDKKLSRDAEWRGSVNAKLDLIVGISHDVEKLQIAITDHEGRICTLEHGLKSVHYRIDEMVGGG